MMKRLAVLLCLLLLFTLPCAAAPVTDQVLELRHENGTLSLITTGPVTFWESPRLQAGETVTVPGKLTLKNTTDIQRTFTFTEVLFPYDDEAALEYLNPLHVDVYVENDLLYSGAYSGINDEAVRPAFNCTLAAGESITYTLYLRCDYAYGGTAYLGNAILDWQFNTPLTESDLPQTEPQRDPAFGDPLIWQWLIGGGVAFLLMAGIVYASKKLKR